MQTPVVPWRLALLAATSLTIASTDDASNLKSDADCEYWAEAGECEKNSKFMLRSCAASCDRVLSPERLAELRGEKRGLDGSDPLTIAARRIDELEQELSTLQDMQATASQECDMRVVQVETAHSDVKQQTADLKTQLKESQDAQAQALQEHARAIDGLQHQLSEATTGEASDAGRLERLEAVERQLREAQTDSRSAWTLATERKTTIDNHEARIEQLQESAARTLQEQMELSHRLQTILSDTSGNSQHIAELQRDLKQSKATLVGSEHAAYRHEQTIESLRNELLEAQSQLEQLRILGSQLKFDTGQDIPGNATGTLQPDDVDGDGPVWISNLESPHTLDASCELSWVDQKSCYWEPLRQLARFHGIVACLLLLPTMLALFGLWRAQARALESMAAVVPADLPAVLATLTTTLELVLARLGTSQLDVCLAKQLEVHKKLLDRLLVGADVSQAKACGAERQLEVLKEILENARSRSGGPAASCAASEAAAAAVESRKQERQLEAVTQMLEKLLDRSEATELQAFASTALGSAAESAATDRGPDGQLDGVKKQLFRSEAPGSSEPQFCCERRLEAMDEKIDCILAKLAQTKVFLPVSSPGRGSESSSPPKRRSTSSLPDAAAGYHR